MNTPRKDTREDFLEKCPFWTGLKVSECEWIIAYIEQALKEQRERIRKDMKIETHGWYGSGTAMVEDYFNSLKGITRTNEE